jgi:hypothetical protein
VVDPVLQQAALGQDRGTGRVRPLPRAHLDGRRLLAVEPLVDVARAGAAEQRPVLARRPLVEVGGGRTGHGDTRPAARQQVARRGTACGEFGEGHRVGHRQDRRQVLGDGQQTPHLVEQLRRLGRQHLLHEQPQRGRVDDEADVLVQPLHHHGASRPTDGRRGDPGQFRRHRRVGQRVLDVCALGRAGEQFDVDDRREQRLGRRLVDPQQGGGARVVAGHDEPGAPVRLPAEEMLPERLGREGERHVAHRDAAVGARHDVGPRQQPRTGHRARPIKPGGRA